MSNTLYHTLGESFFERSLYENSDCTVKNVSGHTSYIKVAKYYESAAILTIPGALETNGTDGIFKYELAATNFASIQHGTYVYSRYLLDATPKIVSVVSGTLVLIPSVK